jgi:hypothetical protein
MVSELVELFPINTGYGRVIAFDFDNIKTGPQENPTMSFRAMQMKEL